MQAQQSFSKPSNWQDLELLSKNLWGEIWQCAEIKMNGRKGQKQNGVDIYGMPAGENGYYGIQCKGRDKEFGRPFTEKEILREIDKAKGFTPGLKKLYFVTTASKDSQIESFFLQKNLEHKSIGIFEVHLFCWEDIVDLMVRNKNTFDWYVNGQNYIMRKSAVLSFDDGSFKVIRNPQFKKTTIEFREAIIPADYIPPYAYILIENQENNSSNPVLPEYANHCTNHSYFPLQIRLKNSGNSPLHEFVIRLECKGNISGISESNISGGLLAYSKPKSTNVIINFAEQSLKVQPGKTIFVAGDDFYSDIFYIKAHAEETNIQIKWTLLSSDFTESGILEVELKPIIENETVIVMVEDLFKVKTANAGFRDYCTGY